jgi:tetratricopeptide (TPR) repeat protein
MAKNSRQKNQPVKGPRSSKSKVAAPIELLPPTAPATTQQRWLPIAIVTFLALVVYLPCADNEFVSWDDDHYLYNNHQVHYKDGIQSIWFDVLRHEDKKFISKNTGDNRVSHQYYPLVFTLYWLEFRFHVWFNDADPEKTIAQNIADGKMTARSFHVVSVVLHALNTVLLILCFRRLGISNWVAWAATILFAVHPMQVASVAWAAERKNILSLMFYLLSLVVYIKMRRQGGWWRYALSLVLFQAALFSKTVALTLPIMLFFTDRLLERRWTLQLIQDSCLRILPFVTLSVVAAVTTMEVEDRDRDIPLTELQRPFVPAASLLFYPVKMLVPIKLSPVYRLWEPDPTDILWYLPTVVAVVLAGLIIFYRRKLGPHVIWAVLFYCVTQGPMLGLKDINYFQFALVADHYFYHGSVGLFLLLALGLDYLRRNVSPPRRGFRIATALVAVGASLYGLRTLSYCDVWQTPETFWARTLEMNDTCWPAYFNTANARVREAHAATDPEKVTALYDDAAERYHRVTEIRTQIAQPFDRLVEIYRIQDKWDEALATAEEAAGRFPQLLRFHVGAGAYAYMVGDHNKGKHYFQTAQFMGKQVSWRGLPEDYRQMSLDIDAAAKSLLQKGSLEQAVQCFAFAGILSDELARTSESNPIRGFRDGMQRYQSAAGLSQRIGRLQDADKYYRLAADRAVRLSETYGKAGQPCGVKEGYEAASSYLMDASRLNPRDESLKQNAMAMRQKYEDAKKECPGER